MLQQTTITGFPLEARFVFNPYSVNTGQPWRYFDRVSRIDELTQSKTTPKESSVSEDQGRLFCTHCGLLITHRDQSISVAGNHQHRFQNPNDITFHIACFRLASGCIEIGSPTQRWTWFSGYAWQVSLCQQCQAHLGWHYRSVDASFYGLIINRLTEKGSQNS